MKFVVIVIAIVGLTVLNACSSGKNNATDSKEKTVNNSPEKGPVQNGDNSDEWIMSQIRQQYPDISKNDVCIVRPTNFKNLALVGMFAHDRGCRGRTAYYGQEKGSIKEFASKVLNDHGWSDRTKRADLAMDYTREVIQVWEGIMTETTESFEKNEGFEFSEPQSTLEDGEVTVTCWVQAPAGMVPEDEFYHLTVMFSKDGEVMSKEISNRFSEEF